MATGPRECQTYVLSASYKRGSANNHTPAVLPVVVLGGDEDDALGAAACDVCGETLRAPWVAAYLSLFGADPALLSQIDRTQVRRAGSLNALHGTARPHRMHPAFSLHPRLRPASALIVDRSISFSTPVQPGAAPRRDPDVVRMHLAF